MTKTLLMRVLILFSGLIVCSGMAVGGSWPGWRGDGSGVSSQTGLPVAWNRTVNVKWKSPLPGEGSSSPVVSNGKVFLTSSSEDGKLRHIICLDQSTGKLLWDTNVNVEKVGQTHPYSGYAAPTPVTDGKTLYAFFESPGLIALDYSGKILWTTPVGAINNIYNLASSPVLTGDLVIVTVDHYGDSYVAGIEKSSGKFRWKTKRAPCLNYSTPIVTKADGRTLIVVNSPTIRAYDAVTGSEVWHYAGMTDAVTPSPVQMDGLVLCTSGRNGPTVILDPKGTGDAAESCVVALIPTGGPYVVSPVAAYGLFMIPNDNGSFRVFDRSGTYAFEHRFPGQFSSSPVAMEGKIYWISERGDTYIFSIGNKNKPEFKLIRVNSLGERVLASPAVTDKQIFIRTTGQLYCISGTSPLAYKPKPASPTPDYEDIKERILGHPGIDEGNPNIAIRVELVDKMGLVKHPDAPEFLKKIIMDDHWDVSETAVRSLGKQGPAAIPVLLELTADYRQWVKTIACQSLGSIAGPEGLPALAKASQDPDKTVRIAAMQAALAIARRDSSAAEAAGVILEPLLKDPEAVVRASAAREPGELDLSPETRQRIIESLTKLASDPNPVVASNARLSLEKLQSGKQK